MKRKMKLNKKGKVLIIILIIIIFLILFAIFKRNNNLWNNQIIKTDKYNLSIYYEKTNIKLLDDQIKEYILSQKKEFIDTANKNNTDNMYDFIYESQVKEYNDIFFIHSVLYKYLGGVHYEREDKSFVYDSINKKFLTINDFINGEDEMLKLSLIAKHKIYGYSDINKIEIDKDNMNIGTLPSLENYEHFYFSDSGITIIFVPMQILSWSEGEIKIDIPYEEINSLLKDKYKNINYTDNVPTKIEPIVRNIEKYKNKKLIAFTFDDGPNNNTTKILLDGLEEYDAKVTFFVLGSRVSYNEEILKRAYKEGNEIGSHTYSHRNLLKLSDEELKSEINNTNKSIKNILGINPKLIRPPYGNINTHIKQLTMMHTICWDIDSNDWRYKDRYKIMNEIVKHAHDGAIVLVHDIYKESVLGSLLAMKELKKEGYEFVTISEMIKLKNIVLDYDTTYYGF